MIPDACPKCGTRMESGQEVCVYCRRKRTPEEIAAAARGFQEPAAPTATLKVLGWLGAAVAAAAAGALLLRSRAAVTDAARAGVVALSIASTLAGGNGGAEAPAAASAPARAPSAAGAPPATAEPVPTPAAPPRAPTGGSCRAPVPREPRRAGDSERIVYGVVRDILTGCPIPGAKTVLRVEGESVDGRAVSDASGFFEVSMNKGARGAAALSFSAPGYREGQLEDVDPPYRDREAESRQETLYQLNAEDLEPIPVRYPPSAEQIRVDAVLIPSDASMRRPAGPAVR